MFHGKGLKRGVCSQMNTIGRVLVAISIIGAILFGLLGAIYEIVGHAKFEQLLSSIGISNGFCLLYIFGIVVLMLLIISCLVNR